MQIHAERDLERLTSKRELQPISTHSSRNRHFLTSKCSRRTGRPQRSMCLIPT